MLKTPEKGSVGERLLEVAGGKTQTQIARLIGVSQPTVSEWGRSGHFPSMENAVALASAFGVCVEWLLMDRGPKFPDKPIDPRAQELWELWKDLDDDMKIGLIEQAKFRLGQSRGDKST
jgi:transcriptional regulator with XRE-family HTH domain